MRTLTKTVMSIGENLCCNKFILRSRRVHVVWSSEISDCRRTYQIIAALFGFTFSLYGGHGSTCSGWKTTRMSATSPPWSTGRHFFFLRRSKVVDDRWLFIQRRDLTPAASLKFLQFSLHCPRSDAQLMIKINFAHLFCTMEVWNMLSLPFKCILVCGFLAFFRAWLGFTKSPHF